MQKRERTCFLVCPLGESGSEVRQAADDLYDLIIVPALKIFQMEVVRADMIPSPSIITNDIVQLVQQSELCVIDLTGSNPNVFYECGRRHETGKPFIQLIRKGESLPFDVQGIRTIEYDLTTPRNVHDAIETIQQFVVELEKGFGPGTRGVSLISISETLQRLERGIDHVLATGGLSASATTFVELDPIERMKYRFAPDRGLNTAMETGDVNLARECLRTMVDEGWDSNKLFSYAYILAGLGDQKVAKPIVYEILDKESFDLFYGLPGETTDDIDDTTLLPTGVVERVRVIFNIFDMFNDYEERVRLLIPRIKQVLEEKTELTSNEKSSLLDYIAVSYSHTGDFESAVKYSKRALDVNPNNIKTLLDQLYYYEQLERPETRIEVAKRLIKHVDDFDEPKYFEELLTALYESGNDNVVQALTQKFEGKYPDAARAFAETER